MSTIGLVDALANTRIGGPDNLIVNIWFTPKWSGMYDTFKTFLITAEQQASQSKTGYAAGTNGTIELSLNGYVLGRYKPQVWPVWKFPMLVGFAAGQYNLLTFKNVDPQPDLNYCSLDALQCHTPLTAPDAGVSYLYKTQLVDRGYVPIFSLEGPEDNSLSYGWMEVEPQLIKPGRAWRQVRYVTPATNAYLYLPVTAQCPPIRKGLTQGAGAAADGTLPSFPDPAPGEHAEYSDDGGKTWQQQPGMTLDLQYGRS